MTITGFAGHNEGVIFRYKGHLKDPLQKKADLYPIMESNHMSSEGWEENIYPLTYFIMAVIIYPSYDLI